MSRLDITGGRVLDPGRGIDATGTINGAIAKVIEG